jgi:hypothetical protein
MSFSPETEKLVNELIQAEYKNACKKFGEKYNSLHEGYAVLLEEVEEASEDMTRIKYSLEDFWKWIKQDTKINPKDIDIVIEEYLEYCISELAQVGAVLMKIKNTFETEVIENWNKVDEVTQKLCLTAIVNKTYDEVTNDK